MITAEALIPHSLFTSQFPCLFTVRPCAGYVTMPDLSFLTWNLRFVRLLED